jgi:hypothetical protein
MACVGVAGAVWALFGLPKAVARLGLIQMIRSAGFGLLITFCWPILANELRRHGHDILFYTLLPSFVAVQAVTLSTNGS